MGLPIREIRLIEVLLRHPEGLTADDLADRLGVSARTVHRDLQPAGEFLASYDLTLVRQAGRGINVEGPDSARARALVVVQGLCRRGGHGEIVRRRSDGTAGEGS